MYQLPDPIDFVPELVSTLGSGRDLARHRASVMLRVAAGEHPGHPDLVAAVPALVAALDDNHRWVRTNAAWALGHIAAHAAPASRALGELFHYEVPTGPIILVTKDNFDAVDDLLRKEEEGRRAARIVDLAMSGHDSALAMPKLLYILRTGDAEARTNAAAALGLIGPAAAPAIAALEPLLDAECPILRATTLIALERIEAA